MPETDLHTYTWSVNGVRPQYQDILKLDIDQGRFFNGAEDVQRAHVCVIGSENKTKLFSGGWALGETIRLDGEPFTIIGVLSPKMQESESDINRQIYIPLTHMGDLKDTQYVDGIWFAYTGDNQMAEKALRQSLAKSRHTTLPARDHNAIHGWPT